MNQPIHWGKVAVLVVAIVAITGVFYVVGKKSGEVPVADTVNVPVSTVPQTEKTVVDTQQVVPPALVSRPAPTIDLASKWGAYGFGNWKRMDFFGMGMTASVPSDPVRFVMKKEEAGDFTDVGVTQGRITVTDQKNKLYGDVIVSASVGTISDPSLEAWIKGQAETAHEDYCKKYGTATLANPKNKVCDTDIRIVKTFNDKLIQWNENFIGSPDIVSVLAGGKVVNFELGQNVSSSGNGGGDFSQFIADIASTLHE